MAPIDPLQLLKALGPLLSSEGGIKSGEVPRLSWNRCQKSQEAKSGGSMDEPLLILFRIK